MVATPLQACLTQIKKKKKIKKKLEWRAMMLPEVVPMAQKEGRSGEFTTSKQAFASPSKATWFHPSLEASYIA